MLGVQWLAAKVVGLQDRDVLQFATMLGDLRRFSNVCAPVKVSVVDQGEGLLVWGLGFGDCRLKVSGDMAVGFIWGFPKIRGTFLGSP